MARWESDSRGRLERAALDLFARQGYEHTTVAEIASAAGVTERTYYRHFADKREVLFGGAAMLEALLVDGVAGAPVASHPLDAVAVALRVAGARIEERGALATQRQAIIIATPELRERELAKLASLSRSIAGALRDRGITEPAASLVAEAGIGVFKVSFERWVAGLGDPTFVELIDSSLAELRAVTSADP